MPATFLNFLELIHCKLRSKAWHAEEETECLEEEEEDEEWFDLRTMGPSRTKDCAISLEQYRTVNRRLPLNFHESPERDVTLIRPLEPPIRAPF